MKPLAVFQTSNGYVPTFFNQVILTFWKVLTPDRGFLLITLLLGMLYCLFFQGLKAIDSLTCVSQFLFSGVYLNLLFSFKVGPSLDRFCLMSSMFIIILIICIIKATCFNNTTLTAELEGKLPKSRWSLSAHNFLSSGQFHNIFGIHLQKGLIYLCTKKFLPPVLYFSIYNPSPNGQIVSLVGAQIHLQLQLLRAEWYKALKIIHCKISPTEQIEKEVKLQSYILSFLFFSAGEQYMKTPANISMKGQRIDGALSRVLIQSFNQLQLRFCGIRS